MERDGLLILTDTRELELTEEGREHAIAVMRRHRLAERLLVDVVGLDWAYVHEEACRWEHVMSGRVEERLTELLGSPTTDPYGNPIPGADSVTRPDDLTSLSEATVDLEDGASATYELVRIGEPLQVDTDLLGRMKRLSLLPGTRVTVTRERDLLVLVSEGAEEGISLAPTDARHLAVRA